jgi:hypothetical protein
MNEYEKGLYDGMDRVLSLYSGLKTRTKGAISFQDLFDEVQDYKRGYVRAETVVYEREEKPVNPCDKSR